MTAHEEAVQRHARVLKAMIWGMGVLIAAAAVVVVTMIVKAVHRPEVPAIIAGLPVPAGCSIVQMTTSGDRLVLSLGEAVGGDAAGGATGGRDAGGGAACRRILIADLTTGRLIGQFDYANK